LVVRSFGKCFLTVMFIVIVQNAAKNTFLYNFAGDIAFFNKFLILLLTFFADLRLRIWAQCPIPGDTPGWRFFITVPGLKNQKEITALFSANANVQ